MSRNPTIVVATSLALGLLGLWLAWPDAPSTAPRPADPAPAPVAPATHALGRAEPPPAERREADAIGTAPAPGGATPVPRGRCTGRVVDAATNPVHPARVYVLPWRGDRPHDDVVLQDDVDALGCFEIVPSFDGEVLVVAIPMRVLADRQQPLLHDGLLAAATRARIARGEEQGIGDVVLPRSVTITGTVRLPGREPCVGVHVGWSPDTDSWGLVLDAFVVSGLPDGTVHVDVTRRVGGSAFSGGGETGAAGDFVIATAAGLTGYVYLMNQGGEGQIERLVPERRVTAPAVVDFDLLAPSCVRVVAAGEPVPGIVARIELNLGNGRTASENYRSNDAGEVRILREREAPTRGRILRPGRQPLTFDVPADATPTNPLVVELVEPGTVATTPVQVVLTSEVPVRTLAGSLWRLDVPSTSIQLRAKPDVPLVAMDAAVPPGPYRLRLSTAAGAAGDDTFVLWHTQDVTVGNEPVQVPVQLQHGGRIRIDVQAKDGQFVPGKVRLVDADGRQSSPSLHAPGRGNGPGGELWAPGPLSTAVSALPPGRYEVVVDVGAHGVHRRFVDVRRCAVADVTFTLP